MSRAGGRSWPSWPTIPMPRPDPEAVAEAVFAALAEPTRRSILSGARCPGPDDGDRPGRPAADLAAGDHQAPRAARRRGPRTRRAWRAAPDPLPRQRGADGDCPV